MTTTPTTAFHGVIPPMVTPLTERRELDIPALERLTDFLLEAGVHGLFVLGSTGEAPYLTDRDRQQVIDVVRVRSAGAVPLLVGVVDTAGDRVADRAVAAQHSGADAVVVTPSFFTLAGTDLARHFVQVAERVDIPVVMYHIPTRTGNSVPPAVMAELAERRVITAVKDSGPDFAGFRELLVRTRGVDGFAAFTGSEVLVDAALLAGAAGVMPGLANVDPHGFVRLYDAARRADWPTAMAEQVRLAELLRLIDHGPASAGPDGRALTAFKEAMRLRGLLTSITTHATTAPLGSAEQARLEQVLVATGLR